MKLLIIEDEQDVAQIISKNLKAAGFTVEQASNGRQGSDLARINNYDLILLDYNLPDLDGLGVCKEIREAGIHTPIIMISVRSDIKDKLDLFTAGVDDYLSKPFLFSELLARIRAILRRPKNIQADMMKIDKLEIDFNNSTIKIQGKEIYLSNKEFSLLHYFIQNRGQLLSREMIRDSVWGDDCDPFSNTVETHILKLRKKIDKNKTLIRTVPGRGYRFEK